MDLNKLYHVINEAEESQRFITKNVDNKYIYVFDTEDQKYLPKMFDIPSLGIEEAQRLAQIEADKLNKNPDLVEGPDLMDDEEDTDDMIQCVIELQDIGNGYEFKGMIEDNSNYVSEYDMEVEYEERYNDVEDPTIFPVLAYHRDGEYEFYDEGGDKLNIEMGEHNKFRQDADKPLENSTVPNSIEDIK